MILLDTCALLRLTEIPNRLRESTTAYIASHCDGLLVHAISAFEVALLARRGRVTLPPAHPDPADWFRTACTLHGLTEIPLDGATAAAAVALPPIHQDPCDRFIVAAALHHRVPILTSDQVIPRYPGVTVLW